MRGSHDPGLPIAILRKDPSVRGQHVWRLEAREAGELGRGSTGAASQGLPSNVRMPQEEVRSRGNAGGNPPQIVLGASQAAIAGARKTAFERFERLVGRKPEVTITTPPGERKMTLRALPPY